jgi:drug/metabolite transporter (DMT)-like permease
VDISVLALVLLAAIAHAAWNGWLKKVSPDFVGLAAISIGWLIVGVIGLFFVGLPAAAHWPYLSLTTVVHTIYAALLVNAYRHGELSLTYPIARGTGPVIVALAAPFLLNEYLDGSDFSAVALIVTGILMIGLAGAGGSLHERHAILLSLATGVAAILLSLATGVAIACYTLIDAAGARAGPSPHTYSAWLFVFTAIALLAVAGFMHRTATLAAEFRLAFCQPLRMRLCCGQ